MNIHERFDNLEKLLELTPEGKSKTLDEIKEDIEILIDKATRNLNFLDKKSDNIRDELITLANTRVADLEKTTAQAVSNLETLKLGTHLHTERLYDNGLMLSTEINQIKVEQATQKKHFKWSMWAGIAMTVLGVVFEVARLTGLLP